MSFLPGNLRLLTRFPTLNRMSYMNSTTTTTSTKTNQIPAPTRPPTKYYRIGFAVVGVIAILALFRQSRKEEQLIEHSIDKQHEPPVAIKAK